MAFLATVVIVSSVCGIVAFGMVVTAFLSSIRGILVYQRCGCSDGGKFGATHLFCLFELFAL